MSVPRAVYTNFGQQNLSASHMSACNVRVLDLSNMFSAAMVRPKQRTALEVRLPYNCLVALLS